MPGMYSSAMESWGSYPSIYALGHRALEHLLDGPVYVEEKIDGSQFSFGVDAGGDLRVRSKGATMHVDAPEKMFSLAVATAKELREFLIPGWTYRAEYLAKPKHNTLAYNRTPKKNLILFDINTGNEAYADREHKLFEAERLGLECVPCLHEGVVPSVEFFRELLDRESVLGGQKIEGVVVKPIGYSIYGLDKKALIGKFVSEHFKEVHGREWKKENPGSGDVIDTLVTSLSTPARWAKAVQHLKEAGHIEGSPRDIGKLLLEIQSDVEKECRDEILADLWKWAWPQIRRRTSHGFPEWYKDQLLKSQFEQTEAVHA